MVRQFCICGMLLAVLLAWPAQAQTNDCRAAEREMAYGTAAMEDANDKAGFLRAASQFEGAIRLAPKCAAARFNLGVAYQKAGSLSAAKDAYGQYLRLAPNASDARAVRQRMYKLEYRIGRQQHKRGDTNRTIRQLGGAWRSDDKIAYHVTVSGNIIEIIPTGSYYQGRLLPVCGAHSFRGTIQGLTIQGKAPVDWRCMNKNVQIVTRPMTGTISSDGNTIQLKYTKAVPVNGNWNDRKKLKVIRKLK